MPTVSLTLPVHTDRMVSNYAVLVTGQLSMEIVEVLGEIGKLFGLLNEDAVRLQ